jgi:hypothetical protein
MQIELGAATITTHADVRDNTYICVYSVAEAAKRLGKSESTIRKIAKKLGVKKIAGSAVAGFVKFDTRPLNVVLPFSA